MKGRGLALVCVVALTAGCHKKESTYDASMNAPSLPEAPRAPTVPRRVPAPTIAKVPMKPLPPAVSDEARGKPVSTEIGLASWYGPPYHNRQAADGSIFDQDALTAAHRTLPMGTVVRVTNVATGESVIAKITDRGPFIPGRTLDLSLAAAKAIGVYRAGVAQVKIEAFAHPAADPAGRWCVQIGVFIDAADAIQTKNDLLSRYSAVAKVIEFAGPTGHWVRINPLKPDRLTAEHIAQSIHPPDSEAYLMRMN